MDTIRTVVQAVGMLRNVHALECFRYVGSWHAMAVDLVKSQLLIVHFCDRAYCPIAPRWSGKQPSGPKEMLELHLQSLGGAD